MRMEITKESPRWPGSAGLFRSSHRMGFSSPCFWSKNLLLYSCGMNQLKVRWTVQESAFTLIVFAFLLVERLLRMGDSPANELMRAAGKLYDPFRHHIGSFLLTAGVVVILILVVNHWLFPRYLRHRAALAILPAALLVSWIALFFSFRLAGFFSMEYLLEKIDGAEFRASVDRSTAQAVTIFIVFYSLYLALREFITRWLQSAGADKPLRILQANQVTATVFAYVGLSIFLISFRLLQSDFVAVIYFFVVVPALVSFFVNLYSIFPAARAKKWSTKKLLQRLFVLPLILCLAGWIMYTQMANKPVLPLLYISYVLVVTLIAGPAAWLSWQFQKDRMDSLRGLQAAVGRKDADLVFLRSQINPHFLFNTLNTIYGTALGESAPRTASAVQKLGDMMRFMLHENHRDAIPLERELDYLENYIALQQLRFHSSTGIRIDISILRNGCNHQVAPMLLIPFVENAFKHGVRVARESYILIRFYCSGDSLFLEVVNSIHPEVAQQDEGGGSGVGLENVKQRLGLLYPGKHSLTIRRDDAAFQASLSISLPKNN
ncbi:MAG: hypothetical protein EOO09_08780 [Chitinophagaceae bacterium]|nr:MAG: hypothetical protein EOO09_08780 [Chitinophagaceae bacterium]